MGRPRRLRAIDLYSGVGGWSLGLHMAGIKVVASYERSDAANQTNSKNNRHPVHNVDIRELSLAQLPADIDVVVGSPPCTQFSFSNRGGGGDIADGLVDIIKFLSVVDYLKPRHWVMENVPRVAKIIEKELRPRGKLRPFAHLLKSVHIVNMEHFGLPQRRRRCLAGNLDFALLQSYAKKSTPRTLGDVVRALGAKRLHDPLYRQRLRKADMGGHILEDFLNNEEVRINKASKHDHPIYNRMPFPDSPARSARTITATSSRVSRESVIIRDLQTPSRFRRLTIRESACLQGFPLTFEFFGKTYHQRVEMVGNAFPPLLAFYIAQAFSGAPANQLIPLTKAVARFRPPAEKPPELEPERCGKHYSTTRTFRFAIPDLRLKSGVRFELANSIVDDVLQWRLAFYFGTPKSIESIVPDDLLYKKLIRTLPDEILRLISADLKALSRVLRDADINRMQNVWSHRGPGATHPLDVLDRLSFIGKSIAAKLQLHRTATELCVDAAIKHRYGNGIAGIAGIDKIRRLAPLTLSGLLIGSVANAAFVTQEQSQRKNSGVRTSNSKSLGLEARL